MKLHRPLVEGVVEALQRIFEEGAYADKVIERILRSNRKWGSRDRAFVAESVYDTVRWWRLLWHLCFETDPPAAPYPAHQIVALLGCLLLRKGETLPAWPEFSALAATDIVRRQSKLHSNRAVAQSIPDWLDAVGEAELRTQWAAELQALNKTADVVLRANTLKTTRETLLSQLRDDGWEPAASDLAPTAIILGRRGNVYQHPLFRDGHFEVQDSGSQCIAPLLAPEPGMRVIDACAGAGGKTLHLAALMQNRGSIVALDTDERKLEELRRRARRNGVHIVQAKAISSAKVIKRLSQSADRVLLDVPCSGLGVLRRNPDAKWKLSPEFLQKVQLIQQDILQRYSQMLRPGGLLLYATCSILPSENEKQVGRFLEERKDFERITEQHLLPSANRTDGFYMALLRRGG